MRMLMTFITPNFTGLFSNLSFAKGILLKMSKNNVSTSHLKKISFPLIPKSIPISLRKIEAMQTNNKLVKNNEVNRLVKTLFFKDLSEAKRKKPVSVP